MDYKNEGTACPGNWLVIYDNYNGKEKEVSFDIDNKGACPVMVRVGKKKHETPEGGSKEIPGNKGACGNYFARRLLPFREMHQSKRYRV